MGVVPGCRARSSEPLVMQPPPYRAEPRGCWRISATAESHRCNRHTPSSSSSESHRTGGETMTTSSITSRRSLHLVDLENLVGDPRAGGATGARRRSTTTSTRPLAARRSRHRRHQPVADGRIAFDLPVPANLHAVHGPDGADTMLLALGPARARGEALRTTRRRQRRRHLRPSGADASHDLGVPVEVVARPDGLLDAAASLRLHVPRSPDRDRCRTGRLNDGHRSISKLCSSVRRRSSSPTTPTGCPAER